MNTKGLLSLAGGRPAGDKYSCFGGDDGYGGYFGEARSGGWSVDIIIAVLYGM